MTKLEVKYKEESQKNLTEVMMTSEVSRSLESSYVIQEYQRDQCSSPKSTESNEAEEDKSSRPSNGSLLSVNEFQMDPSIAGGSNYIPCTQDYNSNEERSDFSNEYVHLNQHGPSDVLPKKNSLYLQKSTQTAQNDICEEDLGLTDNEQNKTFVPPECDHLSPVTITDRGDEIIPEQYTRILCGLENRLEDSNNEVITTTVAV